MPDLEWVGRGWVERRRRGRRESIESMEVGGVRGGVKGGRRHYASNGRGASRNNKMDSLKIVSELTSRENIFLACSTSSHAVLYVVCTTVRCMYNCTYHVRHEIFCQCSSLHLVTIPPLLSHLYHPTFTIHSFSFSFLHNSLARFPSLSLAFPILSLAPSTFPRTSYSFFTTLPFPFILAL